MFGVRAHFSVGKFIVKFDDNDLNQTEMGILSEIFKYTMSVCLHKYTLFRVAN